MAEVDLKLGRPPPRRPMQTVIHLSLPTLRATDSNPGSRVYQKWTPSLNTDSMHQEFCSHTVGSRGGRLGENRIWRIHVT